MSFKIIKFEDQHIYLVDEVTAMLHQAYSALVNAGMTATVTQNSETTLHRLKSGDSFLGIEDSKVVATITLVKSAPAEPIEWFSKPGIFHFTQFAVKPELQGKGFGATILKHIEIYVKVLGAEELALDTSESATDLVHWYKKRGYRIVQYCALPKTTYKTVVLSKSLRSL